jgi:hypothetical protein
MAPPRPPLPPGLVVLLLAMATGHAHVVPLFAKLGMASALDGHRLSAAELAEKTGTRPEALARFLAFCTCIGLVRQSGGLFELTETGQMLATPAFGEEAAARGEASHLAVWQHLEAALRGEPSAHAAVPRRARVAAMHFFALREYIAGFKRSETYVDVGSGDSSLLAGILKASARSEGIYVDRASELTRMKAELKTAGVAHQCDFLEPAATLPPGDAYVVSNRLEQLGDDAAAALLGRCRASMRANGRVLVIGPLVHDQFQQRLPDAAVVDLEMLVFTPSGRARDEAELSALCTRAGLVVRSFVRASIAYVLEATAA